LNVSLVVNPVAGNRAYRYIKKIESLLRNRVSLTTFITGKKGEAQAYAREVSPTDLIIIASGDGTINEVVNGLLSSEKPGQDKIPLALIPLGITNVLAKELGISEKIEQAIDIALTGTSRRISLGKINGRYFTLMAGIGFDGETVLNVKDNIIKKISGKGAHIISGINVLKRYNPPVIKIKTSESEFTGYTAIVSNARCYGGHYYVTPRACITDPVLDICIFSARRRRDLLRFVTGVIRKKHLSYHDVSYCKTSEVEISSDSEVHIQIDGDYFGTVPAKIVVIPDAVSLVW
jgi:YegS/Rv2252/BmrU family lipid kinase